MFQIAMSEQHVCSQNAFYETFFGVLLLFASSIFSSLDSGMLNQCIMHFLRLCVRVHCVGGACVHSRTLNAFNNCTNAQTRDDAVDDGDNFINEQYMKNGGEHHFLAFTGAVSPNLLVGFRDKRFGETAHTQSVLLLLLL